MDKRNIGALRYCLPLLLCLSSCEKTEKEKNPAHPTEEKDVSPIGDIEILTPEPDTSGELIKESIEMEEADDSGAKKKISGMKSLKGLIQGAIGSASGKKSSSEAPSETE
jgi:hypothetical protein